MVVRGTIDSRSRAVLLYIEGVEEARQICIVFGISRRTLTRWVSRYRDGGIQTLVPERSGPRHPNDGSIPRKLEKRILRLKQKHPSWGARRIRYQYDLPCSWRTVHRIIKRSGMLIRIK